MDVQALTEQLGISPATLRRVAVVCVVGYGDVLTRLFEFVGQRGSIKPGLLVIDKVLKMIGIAALLGHAEKDDRFGYEDAPLGFSFGHMLIDLGVAVVQGLCFRRKDSPAVFSAHGEQAPPDILTKSTGPKFKCPVASKFGIAAPNCFLHGAGNRWK
jgi:hypothetical protein